MAGRKSFAVKIEGRKELEKMLDLIPKRVNQVLGKAMEIAIQPIKRAAERKAPIRKTGKGGTLRDNFHTTLNERPGNVAIFLGPGEPAFYGVFYELGTKNQPARPFFRPAFDETHKFASKAFGFVVAKAIRRAIAETRLRGPS